MNPDPEAVINFFLEKTGEMLDWQDELRDQGVIPKDAYINFVYLDEADNIVGVKTNFEMHQYSTKKSKISLPHFKVLERYGQELEKSIAPADKLSGRSLYAMFIAVKAELMGSGASMLFWMDASHYLAALGFKSFYGRCSNLRSLALVVKNGG